MPLEDAPVPASPGSAPSGTGSGLMCPSGNNTYNDTYWLPPSSQTDEVGNQYISFRSASATTQHHSLNYAVNATWSTGGPNTSFSSKGLPTAHWFPMTFLNGSTLDPKIPTMDMIDDPSLVALAFDGLWMHHQDARRFSLRHNGQTSMNMAFADGHVSSIKEGEGYEPGDDLSDRDVLNNDGMEYSSYKLTTSRIPGP